MNTSDSRYPKGIRLGAAVAACAAVLLAAGCGSSKSSKTSNAAAATTSTSSASAGSTSASASGSTGSTGSADGGAGPSTAGSDSSPLPPKPTTPGPGGPHDCSTDMLSFSIQPLKEPVNHVMIQAKNTSQLPCHLIAYPKLSSLQAGMTLIPEAAATKPAAVITLAPGDTAYAGLMTNSADGSGKNGKNIPSLLLELQSSSPSRGGNGRPVTVPMPPGATYIDSSAVVTYWESDIQKATY